MVETCKHCGTSINTHCRNSQTCTCGRPINAEITVIGTLDKGISFATGISEPFGYQGLSHYENVLVIDRHPVQIADKLCYIDNKRTIYIIGKIG